MAGPSQLTWASCRGLPLSPRHKAAAQLPCILGNPSRPEAGGGFGGEREVFGGGAGPKKRQVPGMGLALSPGRYLIRVGWLTPDPGGLETGVFLARNQDWLMG